MQRKCAKLFYYLDYIRKDVSKIPKFASKQIQEERRDASDLPQPLANKSPSDTKLDLISSMLPKAAELDRSKVRDSRFEFNHNRKKV